MKHFFYLILLLLSSQSVILAQNTQNTQNDYLEGSMQGKLDAQKISTSKYTGGGVAGALLANILGAGISYGITAGKDANPPTQNMLAISQKPSPYQLGYQEGYSKTLESKRKRSSIIGGAIGVAVNVIVFIALNSSVE